jgi:hypothetical protein
MPLNLRGQGGGTKEPKKHTLKYKAKVAKRTATKNVAEQALTTSALPFINEISSNVAETTKILSKMMEKSQVSAVEALEEVCANTSIENLQQAIRTIDPKTCTDSTTDKKLKSCSLYFVKNMDKVKGLHDALGGFIEGAQSSLMFVLDEASSQAEKSFDLGKFRDLMEKAVSFKMGQQSQSLPSSVQQSQSLPSSVQQSLPSSGSQACIFSYADLMLFCVVSYAVLWCPMVSCPQATGNPEGSQPVKEEEEVEEELEAPNIQEPGLRYL